MEYMENMTSNLRLMMRGMVLLGVRNRGLFVLSDRIDNIAIELEEKEKEEKEAEKCILKWRNDSGGYNKR